MAGRTPGPATPLQVRTTGMQIDPHMRGRVRSRLGRGLGKFATHIERVAVRFRDINGPRGGVDTDCAIHVVMSGLPSVRVEKRARDPRRALGYAASAAERSVRRSLERPGRSEGAVRAKRAPRQADSAELPTSETRTRHRPGADGSLICRRVGRSAEQLRSVAERPEKHRRDVPVNTALPGTSASDRKAGAGATAKRNTKLNTAGITDMLEDSVQDRPSRKSTRKSSGRAKRDASLRLRSTARARSAAARARKR